MMRAIRHGYRCRWNCRCRRAAARGAVPALPGIAVDPAVSAALDQAAGWLQAAGYVVEEAALPGFLEAAELWRTLTTDDARRSVVAGVCEHGDEAIRRSLHNMMEGMAETDRDGFLDGWRAARRWRASGRCSSSAIRWC